MCGLFGIFSSSITQSEREMFVELGMVSALRGEDSTGVIIGSRKKKGGHKFKVDIKKDVQSPSNFFGNYDVHKAISVDHTFLLAGHCRKTTSGHTNFRNAHPIQSDNIFLCHNGTITKWEPPKGKEAETSDSRIFAGKISSLGIEAATKEAEVGAYAITYVDTQKKTFAMARNGGRTLYAVLTNDDETVMWASEAGFLDLILRRNGVRHNWGPVQLVPQHKHIEWSFYARASDGGYKDLNVVDLTKYGTNVGEVLKGNKDYQEWLMSRTAGDYSSSYGDPAFEVDQDEMSRAWDEYLNGANDENPVTNNQATITTAGPSPFKDGTKLIKGPVSFCKDCKKDEKYCACDKPAGAGAFCNSCKERMGECNCTSPKFFWPHPWELDARGRWKPEDKSSPSVPLIGPPKPDDLITVGELRELQMASEKELTKRDKSSPLGQLEKWFDGDTDNDTYLGFLRQPYSPSIASERLKGGCHCCGHESKPRDTVFWYSDHGHVCVGCHDHGKTFREMVGNVSTYMSKYIDGEKNAAVH